MSFRLVWAGIAVVFVVEVMALAWALAERHDVSFESFGLQNTAKAQSTVPGGTTQVQDPSPDQDAPPAQGTGTCDNAQLIDTFQGNGDQQTDTFETTTNSFRVSYEITDDDPQFPAQLFIDIIDANDPDQFPVADATQDGSGSGETFVNQPPGTYFLDIASFGGEYTITVEQCDNAAVGGSGGGGSGGGGSGGGGSGGGGGQQVRPGDLEAGGPASDPMPTDRTAKTQKGEMSLTVPRLDLKDVPVPDGSTQKELDKEGIIRLRSSGAPWREGSNTSIVGHRIGFPWSRVSYVLYELDKMRPGDRIIVKDSAGKKYVYEVYHSLTVRPEHTWVMYPVGNKTMISLQTCTPIPTFEKRLVVRGELVSMSQAKDTQLPTRK